MLFHEESFHYYRFFPVDIYCTATVILEFRIDCSIADQHQQNGLMGLTTCSEPQPRELFLRLVEILRLHHRFHVPPFSESENVTAVGKSNRGTSNSGIDQSPISCYTGIGLQVNDGF